LETSSRQVTIINVYNPRSGGPRIQEWPRVAQALEEAKGEILLLGDFNVHHPAWGGVGVAYEQSADHLLHAVEARGLHLLTPRGETTWRRGPQATVIDLTFASDTIRERLEYCGPEERWAMPQDHIPIRINLNIRQAPDKQAKRMRYAP
jgi:endonuclease/exonuclease/phosphatase family metal-dependent hydrolase